MPYMKGLYQRPYTNKTELKARFPASTEIEQVNHKQLWFVWFGTGDEAIVISFGDIIGYVFAGRTKISDSLTGRQLTHHNFMHRQTYSVWDISEHQIWQDIALMRIGAF